MVNELREKISVFLKAWGLSAAPAPEGTSAAQGVDVILNLAGDDRLLVGTLSCDRGEYVFEYSDDFRRRHELPSIGAFPNRDEVYRSVELWPFFQVRLPPFDRPDVRQVLEAQKLDRSDLMSVLPVLGGRTVTSPYNLVPHGSAA